MRPQPLLPGCSELFDIIRAGAICFILAPGLSWCQERLRSRGNGCGFDASGNSTGGNPAVQAANSSARGSLPADAPLLLPTAKGNSSARAVSIFLI